MSIKRIFVACALALLVGCSRTAPRPEKAHPTITGKVAGARPGSLVYPYSVVPGGVESREDVERAMGADALTLAHYSDVDVAHLEPVVLKSEMKAYVSYRKDGRIYWTRNPVRLAAGERVLSNGKDCLRGRCGNRVSMQPKEPVIEEADREPSPAAFQTPVTETGRQVMDEILDPLPMMAMVFPPATLLSNFTPPAAAGVIPPAMPMGADAWPPGPAPAQIPSGSAPSSLFPFATGTGGGIVPSTPTTPVTPTTPWVPVTPVVPNFPTSPTPITPNIVVPPTTPVTPFTPPANPPTTPTTPHTPVTPPVTPPVIPPTPPVTPPDTPPVTPPVTPPDTPPVTPPDCCVVPPDVPPVTPPPVTPPDTPPLTPTPEPAAVVMVGGGLLWVASRMRSRRTGAGPFLR